MNSDKLANAKPNRRVQDLGFASKPACQPISFHNLPTAVFQRPTCAIATLACASIAAVRFQKGNDLGAVRGRRHAAVGLHLVPGHNLVRIGDETIERGPVPHLVGAFQRARIAVIGQRSSFAPNDLVQIGSKAIVAFARGMAGAADVVEGKLAIFSTGSAAASLLSERRLRGDQQERRQQGSGSWSHWSSDASDSPSVNASSLGSVP